jgi:hypothetical protein
MRIIKSHALAVIFSLALAGLARAGTANLYSTSATSGMENSAVIASPTLPDQTYPAPVVMTLIGACNYGTAETVMAFDATALPANGVVPKLELPLSAGTANAPVCGSLSLPVGGVTFYKGVVAVASSTAPLLTAVTTSGGSTFFEIGH